MMDELNELCSRQTAEVERLRAELAAAQDREMDAHHRAGQAAARASADRALADAAKERQEAAVGAALEEAAQRIDDRWRELNIESEALFQAWPVPDENKHRDYALRECRIELDVQRQEIRHSIPDAGAALDRALAQARREERERCAQACDDLQRKTQIAPDAIPTRRNECVRAESGMARNCAAAIRALED